MYDPFAQPQLPQGQTVGMVPGVPGSMGLNPGMGGPIQGQQQPGGPGATPGGGGTGFPLQGPSPNNALGGFLQSPQGMALLQRYPQFQDYLSGNNPHQAMMDWGGQRPDHQTYTGSDWRGAMQDWRQQRPARRDAIGTPAPAPTGMFPPQPGMAPASKWNGPRGGAGGGYGF